MTEGNRGHLFDVASSRHTTSPTCADTGILQIFVCVSVAFSQLLLARAQDAVSGSTILPEPTILPELSKRAGPEPMKAERTPIHDAERPSLEVVAGVLNGKPAQSVKQTPPPNTEAIPGAAVDNKPHPAKHRIVQRKALEPLPPAEPMPVALTLSALKAVATSAPLPEYPYQAKRSSVTGSGVCNLVVDSQSGRVTSATMRQSTGSKLLDKVTTDTLRRWQFKPGTINLVTVPITYE